MSNSRVRWTEKERRLVAHHALKRLAEAANLHTHEVTRHDISMFRGFFTVVSKAQEDALPPERRRRELNHFGHVPWIVDAMLAAKPKDSRCVELPKEPMVGTPAPALPEPLAPPSVPLSMENFAALLAPLVAHEVVKILAASFNFRPLKEVRPLAPSSQPEVKAVKKPRVLVYGLMSDQSLEVSKAWSKRFDLRFYSSSNPPEEALSGCEFAVGLTTFMSHSADGKLSKHFKENYIRTRGASTAVKKALNDLWSKINLIQLNSNDKH